MSSSSEMFTFSYTSESEPFTVLTLVAWKTFYQGPLLVLVGPSMITVTKYYLYDAIMQRYL
jgi:hypothetical protein